MEPASGRSAFLADWTSDAWARGAYSFAGRDWCEQDFKTIRTPVGRMVLAGEHTGPEQTMNGAIVSGQWPHRPCCRGFANHRSSDASRLTGPIGRGDDRSRRVLKNRVLGGCRQWPSSGVKPALCGATNAELMMAGRYLNAVTLATASVLTVRDGFSQPAYPMRQGNGRADIWTSIPSVA